MWTKAQQAAIDIKKGNILVSAAAGSGKTAVLVERIIKKITDRKEPIDVDSLLVMTFTRAAAASMKEKIYNALLKEMERYDVDTFEFKRLKEQSILLSSSRIMTTDSFCLSIIKENIDKIEIDPAFSVADENEISLLKADTMEELLESAYEEEESDFLELTDAFANTKGDKSISGFVEKLYNFAISKPWPMEWLESLKEEKAGWQDYIYKEILRSLNAVLSDIDEIIGICQMEEGPANYLDTVLEERSQILNVIKAGDLFELSKKLQEISFGRLKPVRKVNETLKERAKSLRDSYKSTVQSELLGQFFFDRERIEQEAEFERPKVRAIVDLTLKYIKLFGEKKREKALVDFSDIEHIALELLLDKDKNPTEVAAAYRKEFSEIYIDEYQDSNYLQEAIVEAIQKNNVFMVGDVKQSIYGFRQATPQLFTEKYKIFKNYEDVEIDKNSEKKVILSKNFRSRDTVLNSANAIFKRIMKEDIGGIEYDDAAALYPGAVFEEDNKKDFISEIMLTETADIEDDTSNIELEARAIAARIKELKSTLKVKGRALKYSDIVILLRANIGESIAKVLNDENIPAYAQNNKGYFKTFEVRKILAILSAIDNPYSDVDLTAFLNSNIVEMTDLELSDIVSSYRKVKNIEKSAKIKMMDALICEIEDDNINSATRYKIKSALDFLREYKFKSQYMSISALIWDIYNETNFLNIITAMPGGAVRRANLMLLINKARSFANSGYSGLYNFIRYIKRLKDFDNDFGEANILSENDDIVRIMTIHKSKGLEFPVCFLACANKSFNKRDLNEGMVIQSDFGVGVQYVDTVNNIKDTSIKQNVIKHKLKTELLGEELRVLYVALTRAMEKIIISGTCSDIEKALEKVKENPSFLDVRACNSYLDLILLSRDNIHFDIKCYNYKMLLDEQINEQQEVGNLNEIIPKGSDNDVLRHRLRFKYPYQEDVNLKTMFSVSEIKKLSQMEEYERVKKTYTEDASERGNAYHKIMEKIHYEKIDKYENYNDFVVDEISQLKNGKYRNIINVEDIVKFLNTELGKAFIRAGKEGSLKRENQFIMGIPANEAMGEGDETVLIQGIIDAYIDKDEVILADYKTDRVGRAEELIKRYSAQLSLYKKSLEMSTGKKVKEVYIYSFALGREIRLQIQ